MASITCIDYIASNPCIVYKCIKDWKCHNSEIHRIQKLRIFVSRRTNWHRKFDPIWICTKKSEFLDLLDFESVALSWNLSYLLHVHVYVRVVPRSKSIRWNIITTTRISAAFCSQILISWVSGTFKIQSVVIISPQPELLCVSRLPQLHTSESPTKNYVVSLVRGARMLMWHPWITSVQNVWCRITKIRNFWCWIVDTVQNFDGYSNVN